MSLHSDWPHPGRHITTARDATFAPLHDPAGRVGIRATRGGRTDLVYLDAPTDPGNGRPLIITASSRPGTADEHDPDGITATAILGPAPAADREQAPHPARRPGW
ncbi:hypothetical protein [Dactylosporangium darangshiense]|uniref:Xaa-Pro dipeptidyl-peptidase-like domain-containing protein n=1 Tax=Dactylosporangium darangshiense TaxID=579108 RepID=A0ABP8DS78_9ACTN